MRAWQCECGKIKWFGTDNPPQCEFCEKCGTTVAGSPDCHKTERTPHEFYVTQIDTDEGPKPLSRCRYCHRTKAQIGLQIEAESPIDSTEGNEGEIK